MLGIYVTIPVACFRKGLAREYLETEVIPPPSTCYGFLLSLVGEQDRKRHIGCRITSAVLGEPQKSTVLRTMWRIKEYNGWQDESGKWYEFAESDLKRFREWLIQRIAAEISYQTIESRSHAIESLRWNQFLREWIDLGRPIPKSFSVDKELRKQINAWSQSYSEFKPMMGSGVNARPDFQELLTEVRIIIWLESSEELMKEETLEIRVTYALKNPATIVRYGGLSLGESTHLVDEVKILSKIVENSFPKLEKTCRAFVVRDRGRYTLPVWVDHVGSAGTRYATGDLEVRDPFVPPSLVELPRICSNSGAN